MKFVFEPCINVSYCVIVILSNESGHMPTQMPLTSPVLTIMPIFIKQISAVLGCCKDIFLELDTTRTFIRLCCVQFEIVWNKHHCLLANGRDFRKSCATCKFSRIIVSLTNDQFTTDIIIIFFRQNDYSHYGPFQDRWVTAGQIQQIQKRCWR